MVTSNTDVEIKSRILLEQRPPCVGARDWFAGDRDAARWGFARSDRLDAPPQLRIERSVARNMHAARAGDRPADSLR